MDIDSAIQQLARQMGISLKLDATGTCRLIFDGRTAIDIEWPERAGTTLFVHAQVGILPSSGREAVYETLLEANLFGRGTGEAVLAVDAGRQEILLFRRLDMAATEYPAFTRALEDFLTQTTAWTDRLGKGGSPAAAAPLSLGGETFLRV